MQFRKGCWTVYTNRCQFPCIRIMWPVQNSMRMTSSFMERKEECHNCMDGFITCNLMSSVLDKMAQWKKAQALLMRAWPDIRGMWKVTDSVATLVGSLPGISVWPHAQQNITDLPELWRWGIWPWISIMIRWLEAYPLRPCKALREPAEINRRTQHLTQSLAVKTLLKLWRQHEKSRSL